MAPGSYAAAIDDLPSFVPAVSVPATAAFLHRRAHATRILVVAACAISLLSGGLFRDLATADDLQHDGARADATVMKVAVYGRGGRAENGSLIVRWAVEGAPREARVTLGSRIVDFHDGQQVTIVYYPNRPVQPVAGSMPVYDGRIEVLGLPRPTVGWRLPAYLAEIAVALFVSAGLVGLASRRMHRIVRAHPWQLVAVNPIRKGGRLLPRVHLEADTGAGPVIVRPLLFSWFDKRYLPHVWIAGLDAADPDAAVVAVLGGAPMVAVRRTHA
jgi:hypothetical protein